MICTAAAQSDHVVDLHLRMEKAAGGAFLSTSHNADICGADFAGRSHLGPAVDPPGSLDGLERFRVGRPPLSIFCGVLFRVLFAPFLCPVLALLSVLRIGISLLVNARVVSFCGHLRQMFAVFLSVFGVVSFGLGFVLLAPSLLVSAVLLWVFIGPTFCSSASRQFSCIIHPHNLKV